MGMSSSSQLCKGLLQNSSRQFQYPHQHSNLIMNHSQQSIQINQQSLSLLAKEELVENNYQQQLDPLYTTFRPQNKKIYGRFRTLCSNITNQKVFQYRLVFRTQEQFTTYLMSYFWRKNNNNERDFPIVRTTNFNVSQQSKRRLRGGIGGFLAKNCSASKEIICRVYVEDIPLRLCHIKDIPFPQNLYVLRQALRGFQIIYENIGYIKPFEDLICINRKGHVKVWINSDLGRNYPNVQFMDSNVTTSRSQSKLIGEILQLISANTDPQGEPMSLMMYMKQRHVNMEYITFEKVFETLGGYEMELGIEVPEVFGSIVEVLNQQQEEYDTYRTEMEQGNESSSNNAVRNDGQQGNSGLFLDVINSSRHRERQFGYHSRDNSKKTLKSVQNQETIRSSRPVKAKTHSLRNTQQNFSQSVQSSFVGPNNSNNILSESLPLSRELLAQKSMGEVKKVEMHNDSRVRVDSVGNVHGNQSAVLQRNYHASNYTLHQRHPQLNITHNVISTSNLQNMHQNQPLVYITNQPMTSHQQQATRQQSNPKIKSTNKLPSLQPNENEFSRNKKTYSNLWDYRGVGNRVVEMEMELEEEEEMVRDYRATREELQQMVEIDRYLEQQIIQEQYERDKINSIRGSSIGDNDQQYVNHGQEEGRDQGFSLQPYPASTQQQQYYNGYEYQHFNDQQKNMDAYNLAAGQQFYTNQQYHSYAQNRQQHHEHVNEWRMYQQLMSQQQQATKNKNLQSYSRQNTPLRQSLQQLQPPNLKSDLHEMQYEQSSSKHEGMLMTPYQLKASNSQFDEQNESNMPSLKEKSRERTTNKKLTQHEKAMDHKFDDGDFVENSHPMQEIRNQSSYQEANMANSNPNQYILSHFSHRNQAFPNIDSPPSPTPSSHVLPSPVIQDRSVTQSASSQGNFNFSSHTVQNPISVSQVRRQQVGFIVSATSIGQEQPLYQPQKSHNVKFENVHSVKIVKRVEFKKASMPYTPIIPRVTFTINSPDYLSSTSKQFTSLSQQSVSSPPLQHSQNHYRQFENPITTLPQNHLAVSTSNNPQPSKFLPRVQRLAKRANTVMSKYVNSQGNQISSRKEYELEDSSSRYSKPSIVEYSLMKNPEMFYKKTNDQLEINELSQGEFSVEKLTNLGLAGEKMATEMEQHQPIEEQEENKSTDRNAIDKQNPMLSISDRIPMKNPSNHYISYHEIHQSGELMLPIAEQTQTEQFNNSRSLMNTLCEESVNLVSIRPHGSLGQSENIDRSEVLKLNDSEKMGNVVLNLGRQLATTSGDDLGNKLSVSIGNNMIRMVETERENFYEQPGEVLLQQQNILGDNQEILQEENIPHESMSLQSHEYQDDNAQMNGLNDLQPENPPRTGPRSSFEQIQSQKAAEQMEAFSSNQASQHQRIHLSAHNRRNHLRLIPTKSIEGSHYGDKNNSLYRFVESIQENRPMSAYQNEIMDGLEREGDFVVDDNDVTRGNNQHVSDDLKHRMMVHFNRFSAIHTPSPQGNANPFQSPTQSQHISPRQSRPFLKPITGRTMFLNNENELTSQLLGPESEVQSEVDLTYNSYEKWKEKSRMMDTGHVQSRFLEQRERRQVENNLKEEVLNRQHQLVRLAQAQQRYPQRHMNHRQLVRSSIEGMNVPLNGGYLYQFRSDKKNEQQYQYDFLQGQLQTVHQRNNSLTTLMRPYEQFDYEEIDEQILQDLREGVRILT